MNEWINGGGVHATCVHIYRLNGAKRTCIGCWDDLSVTVLQTQNSCPGGLKSSTLPLSPQYWIVNSHFFPTEFQIERNPRAPTLQAGSFNHPSKHGAFTQCCFNVGPASKTVEQHWNSSGECPVFAGTTPGVPSVISQKCKCMFEHQDLQRLGLKLNKHE